MKRRIDASARLALGFLLVVSFGRLAAGQEPIPLYVEFTPKIPRLAARLDDSTKKAEVAKLIIKRLEKDDYKPKFPRVFLPVTDAATQYPRLRVSLSENEYRTIWVMQVELFSMNRAAADSLQAEIVLEAGVLQIVETPPFATIPGLVANRFEQKYLAPDLGEKLQKKLQRAAPVGRGKVKVGPGPPRTVKEADGALLLNYCRFGIIAKANFLVVSQPSNAPNGAKRAPVHLYSSGLGTSCAVSLKGEVVDAILVHHDCIGSPSTPIDQNNLAALADLDDGMFFLLDYQDPWAGLPPCGDLLPSAAGIKTMP